MDSCLFVCVFSYRANSSSQWAGLTVMLPHRTLQTVVYMSSPCRPRVLLAGGSVRNALNTSINYWCCCPFHHRSDWRRLVCSKSSTNTWSQHKCGTTSVGVTVSPGLTGRRCDYRKVTRLLSGVVTGTHTHLGMWEWGASAGAPGGVSNMWRWSGSMRLFPAFPVFMLSFEGLKLILSQSKDLYKNTELVL